MVSSQLKTNYIVSKLLSTYGYAERHTMQDIKELASALIGDPLTKQHGFELIHARPVPVLEIANDKTLLDIWNCNDSKQTMQDLEVLRSVESITN